MSIIVYSSAGIMYCESVLFTWNLNFVFLELTFLFLNYLMNFELIVVFYDEILISYINLYW